MAKEKETGLVDPATEFRKPGTADAAQALNYWAWDKTHLGKPRHDLIERIVLKAIEAGQ